MLLCYIFVILEICFSCIVKDMLVIYWYVIIYVIIYVINVY